MLTVFYTLTLSSTKLAMWICQLYVSIWEDYLQRAWNRQLFNLLLYINQTIIIRTHILNSFFLQHLQRTEYLK